MTAETTRTNVLDPVWDALSAYRIFTSSTPTSFDRKMAHVPMAYRLTVAAIMIDVLRATTTVHACLAAGSRGVVLSIKPTNGGYDLTPPCGGAADWIFGGEENGLPIPGGKVGNSPLVERNILSGKYLKFYSTNGARALAAIDDANVGGIFLASLANIEVTVLDVVKRGFQVIMDRARLKILSAPDGEFAPFLNQPIFRTIAWTTNRGLPYTPHLNTRRTMGAWWPTCGSDKSGYCCGTLGGMRIWTLWWVAAECLPTYGVG